MVRLTWDLNFPSSFLYFLKSRLDFSCGAPFVFTHFVFNERKLQIKLKKENKEKSREPKTISNTSSKFEY